MQGEEQTIGSRRQLPTNLVPPAGIFFSFEKTDLNTLPYGSMKDVPPQINWKCGDLFLLGQDGIYGATRELRSEESGGDGDNGEKLCSQ